ncbi:hypothetical protein H181DRAFT_05276 [Streptomyces sp. WMMB 714]|uniref:hypothetical protein n=1 Tax=Streptomyces sp. WMMB 714 TaxID=1286822 RepID=UPI0005F8084E|nr:hypothetical protein [Streptomyces sp. WMMB 714]SCK56621.1 hypothetical protein H181DRAFT_05276 [Streptomyces sp. WMMB 714]
MTHPETESPRELRVGWLMPSFFHPLPLDVTEPDELVDQIVELATTVLADRSSDEQHFFAQMMLRQTAQLIEAEAEYAGMCFVEHEGEPTMATVLVNRVPSPEEAVRETVEEAAAAIESLLQRRYPFDDIRSGALTLDDAPAVTRTGTLEVSVPPELSPDGKAQTLLQGVIQTYVPLPGQGETMVFELNTPSPSAWEMYTEMFDAVLGTLDWATDEDLAEQRELERIAALPAQREPAASTARPEPAPLDRASVTTVRHHSSLVLGAVGMRGPMPEEKDRLEAVTCEACRSGGLTSGCTVRHHWEMIRLARDELQKMLAAARSRLAGAGLEEGSATGSEVVFSTPEASTAPRDCSVVLTVDPEEGSLIVDVTTGCSRRSATGVADDFG